MSNKIRRMALLAVLLVCAGTGVGLSADEAGQSFQNLAPAPDIIYLLANSSVILGPDPEGKAEDLTFTGTVWVPKFPGDGFGRRKLDNGRFQIDFELTRSELQGESYLMDGPIVLGEHPDLRSLGTITQREPGKDYPADFIVQRKVLIETPRGVMHNEAPVPVRGTIDAIPPVRHRHHDKNGTSLNVFRGEELPVALVDEKGAVAGWFYSRVHVAFAVDPVSIYRLSLSGEVKLKAGDRQEVVAVSGPVELIERADAQGEPEFVMIALRGRSEILGGPIMITEAFHPEQKLSVGNWGEHSRFNLFLEIKSPSGVLEVERPIKVHGTSSARQQTDEVDLGKHGKVPVYGLALAQSSDSESTIVDEAGRTVGMLSSLSFKGQRIAARRPCCPLGSKTR